jgi:nucleotide-binding universal stress UspA family protein
MSTSADAAAGRPVVVCYDGSSAAVEALDYTAAILAPAPAIVVSVWREITEEMASTGAAPLAGDPVEANRQAHRAAKEAAREGAQRARNAGLAAEPLVIRAHGPIWKAIEAVAHDRNALLVVCGTGRSGIKSVLPGDLATALVQHASRPVLVVPTRKAAGERRQQVERD